MSIQRDEILRLTEAVAQAATRIGTLREAGQLREALAEVQGAARSLLGVDLGLLEALGPGPIAAQLGHPGKVEALARLLDERAELERARGDEPAALRWTGRAAGLRTGPAGRGG
jgi:hypothetical protein